MGFGPDGFLYIATGDGGGANDSGPGHTPGIGNAQDITNNPFGKLLRIDPLGTNGPGGQFGIVGLEDGLQGHHVRKVLTGRDIIQIGGIDSAETLSGTTSWRCRISNGHCHSES